MKPSFLNLLASALIAALTAVLCGADEVLVFVLTWLLFFILSFTAIHFIILKSIDRRTKDIFNSIRNYRLMNDEQIPAVNFTNNVLKDLKLEVESWAEDRRNEIEKLKKLETYRKEYIGNVSHELKTPIFNIQGYILTLLDGGLEDQKINRDYLIRAEKSVDRMIGIIDDLEAISQLEAGELQIEPEKFDLVALIKDIYESVEMQAAARHIMLSLAGTQDKPVYVLADRFRIRQVLTNLIVNSIKYGKDYGETKIKWNDIGDNIMIEVADNGLGIDKKHLPRVFERFYRVDKSRSREQGGTGLGLAIVKHIIEAHNQTINVMSTQGAGSVFSFTLKKAWN